MRHPTTLTLVTDYSLQHETENKIYDRLWRQVSESDEDRILRAYKVEPN